MAKSELCNLEAEKSILSSMFASNESIEKAAKTLSAADFHYAQNREIFSSIIDTFNVDKPVDVVTISENLKSKDLLNKTGGLEYLTEVIAFSPTSYKIDAHITIVKEKATRRKLADITKEITNLVYNESEETNNVLDLAEQRICSLTEANTSKEFYSISEILDENIKVLKDTQEGKNPDMGLKTGFSDLDDILSLQKSNLVLIAARPAMGKTSFALNIAQQIASNTNETIAIFSLEMSKEEIANRLWSSETMVEISKIQSGKNISADEWKQLITGAARITKTPIYINDNGNISLTEIRALCRRLQRESGLGCIMIDHMQLMHGTKRTENRQQEISEISRSLKLIAKDLNVPVVVLSQLNRAPEATNKSRPQLSHLRESGAIEQDADIVMMLYREDYYDKNCERPGIAEVIIAKHRNGETGTVELRWFGPFTKFVTLEKRYDDDELYN